MTSPFAKLKNPTKKHKDWFQLPYVKVLLNELNPKDKHFDSNAFLAAFKKEYKPLELKERLNLLARLFGEHFPYSYKKNLRLMGSVLGPALETEDGMFTHSFFIYPLSQYVELNATEDLDASLAFIYEMTTRFTGEWAIRTVANANRALTLKTMKAWSKDNNFHVRRLASEGLRPRLPWGKKISWVNEDLKSVRPIYDRLRNDPVLYVRRSVANTLGDWIKLDEEFALETIDRWLAKKHTKENLWVIKHAIRTPVKKGNATFVNLKKDISNLTGKL